VDTYAGAEAKKAEKMGREPPSLETPFGEVLKAWRVHKGMSGTELADRAGLAQSHVSDIERGKIGLPRKPAREKLARALEIDAWTLYTRELPPILPRPQPRHDDEDAVTIDGRAVQPLREDRGLSQEELATAIGRSRDYVSVIESGEQPRVSRATAEGLAAALGVDLSLLLAPADALDLAHPALPLPARALSDDRRPLGDRIEELMAAARLSADERRLVAEHLVAHATEIIALVAAARGLPRGGGPR
jgi:transcriptional regulator with XRE-family HTH domain